MALPVQAGEGLCKQKQGEWGSLGAWLLGTQEEENLGGTLRSSDVVINMWSYKEHLGPACLKSNGDKKRLLPPLATKLKRSFPQA